MEKANLSSKTHEMTVYTWSDYCGSHGCTGHAYTKLICSCGYVDKLDEYFGRERNLVQEHVAAVEKYQIVQMLGITWASKTENKEPPKHEANV